MHISDSNSVYFSILKKKTIPILKELILPASGGQPKTKKYGPNIFRCSIEGYQQIGEGRYLSTIVFVIKIEVFSSHIY